MAPKANAKKEQQQLEEEAMAEWLARGHRIKDFTMEKMMAIWLEEDGEGDDDDDGGTLSAKEELMKGLSVLDPLIEQAKEYAEKIKETVKEEAVHALKTAWAYAEIPPLKRRRLLREHVAHVHEMDRESDKYVIVRQRVLDEWETAQAAEKELTFGLKKRNARKAPLLLRSRVMKEEADREQQARLLEDIERKRRERMDAELAEKQRQREAREEFADAQRVYRRKMNMKFWQKQYAEAKEYAQQHSLAREDEREEQFAEKVELMKAEIAQMNGEEQADYAQAFDRTPTTSSLGVFGTAFEPGQWESSIDGGPREGLDEHTVGVFSSRGFEAENELLRMELMEAQSKVMALQEKLELLDQVKSSLLADKRMILDRKDKILMEIRQVNAEHDELNQQLAGPPRRDPTEADKLQFHTLVSRRAEYKQQLQDLNAREANIQKRSELAIRSEQNLRPMLLKDQEVVAALEAKVGAIEHIQSDLPMIVGRSIQRDAGVIALPEENSGAVITVPTVNPAKLYADITMASRLALLEHAAVPVKEHYKRAKQLAIEDWKTKELKSLGEQELEVTKNRLGNIRERMIEHQKDSVRADLMQAITRFHQGPLKLRKCIFPIKGHFEWWQSHDPSRSTGVALDEPANVIYLDSEAYIGQLRGRVRLPKSCFYRIDLAFNLQRCHPTNANNSEDEDTTQPNLSADDEDLVSQASEKIIFYIGSDYDSLQEHLFLDIGGKPVHTGRVSFEFYGTKLCYSFNVSRRMGSRVQDAPYRLTLENPAAFEERIHDFREEESRMRMIQKENHVLSELVKTLRMQTKKTSSERCADLLEELVLVETSKATTWDSALLHGHIQRFDRLAYASMLRIEIKKELAHQIDEDVVRRKGRVTIGQETPADVIATEDSDEGGTAPKALRRDASRMEFLARKHALVEPQYRKTKRSLGEYCSFKAPEVGEIVPHVRNISHRRPALRNESSLGSYRRESIVMGLRLEWREGKTKLQVTHKLYGPGVDTNQPSDAPRRIKPTWCVVESANAVFLASACAKALKASRDEEAQERILVRKKEEQVHQLQEETKATMQQETEAQRREETEDALLRKQRDSELSRRAKLFYAEAIRTTTYNEQVSSQIDFLAQRKKNALEQQAVIGDDVKVAWNEVLREVKEDYARTFVEGRLALVRKTWERKERRIQDQREKDRRERAFRIHQEQQLVDAVNSSKDHELVLLQREHAQRMKEQLKIPHFDRAVRGSYPCEHRELKAWGSKYDFGQRCKNCGKEMSKSFDDPDHARGVDPQLDRDVEQHRAQSTGGKALRMRNSNHFDQVEQERVRLEKEAREIDIVDALLYDRMDPKAIEDFNYRHNMNRHPEPIEGSDPIYQRTIQESHHAAFQDEVLYHGRLKNYHFRIQQLNEKHAHTTTMIAVQGVQEENEFVLMKLPLVEKDHARAVTLIEEDDVANHALQVARKELDATRKSRERAYYALEGVEEEAEFAEFHAPSLIESSGVMQKIVDRMADEVLRIQKATEESVDAFDAAEKAVKRTDRVLARLSCRERGARVRTKYGYSRVLYYREEDSCVVVSPELWDATIFLGVEEIVEMEAGDQQAEAAMMEAEEASTRIFLRNERVREFDEGVQMTVEDRNIHEIVSWRSKKVDEEELVRTALCDRELTLQFEYETEKRKVLIKEATEEAKKMRQYSRVSLKRRTIQGKGPARSGRLDVMRVARACEKRLAMASIEQALLRTDKSLRQTFVQERDAMYVNQLSAEVYDEGLITIIKQLCAESLTDAIYDANQWHAAQNQGLVVAQTNDPKHPDDEARGVHTQVRLQRLWVARRHKLMVMHTTWQKEHTKVLALKQEMARRDEILRQQEAERIILENRRKEMLAEERYSRKFYLEEMVLCMKERKEMANAEMEMREYLRQLEVEAMKAKYAAMVEERNKTNDKAARRLEIKLGKNEKHRLHREWAQIKIEDDLAMQVRDEEIARAQAEAMDRLYERFLLQQAAEGKLIAEREAARVAEQIQEAQRVAAEKRAAFEAKLVQERMMATVEAYHLITSLELEWVNAAERRAYWKHKSDQLQANLVPMEVELKRILAEKDHVVADAKAKRTYAELCKQQARDADASLRLAIHKEEECAKQYRKVHFLNSTMDSEVLHDRPQRFRTRYLRDQLHKRYFYLLTESIIRQAIVECNEREAARLQEKLRQIEEERAFKIQEIGVLKRKRRRQHHMQLKRSELGKKLFGFSQRRALKERFQQWVKLWSQRVVVRASFEVKHGLLMQQHRLEQKQAQLKKEDINSKLSILHQYQKRRVVCRLCKTEYTEEQNNRYSCSYHPGAYELACVKSCATRQPGGASATATAANCMMHRARRWLCCDATDEGRYGNNGCARRFHLPQRANPALEMLVEKKEREETSALAQIQKQLDELKERNTFGKAKQATKVSVVSIEQQLAARRAVAAKYHTLDRR